MKSRESVPVGSTFAVPLRLAAVGWVFVLVSSFAVAERNVRSTESSRDGGAVLRLENEAVRLTVRIEDGQLVSERLEALERARNLEPSAAVQVETDGGFGLDLMYTDWRAPGKLHNADNSLSLSKADFEVGRHAFIETASGGLALEMILRGIEHSLEARLTYSLDPAAFYVRRTLSIRDPESHGHFLRTIRPFDAELLSTTMHPLKRGGFGQPVALVSESAGSFFGLEYPTGQNHLTQSGSGLRIVIAQQVGERIGEAWVEGHSAVWGVSSDHRIKRAFEVYLDEIRVAPLRPYLLYNSWYDVRSPEYTEREEDVMNERNLRRIIDDFRNVKRRHPGFRLDTFVLDDGWDVYESDWVLRDTEFPDGLKPVSDALAEMGADLGIWIGPTGGYSFRQKRIDWMKANGYEVVGDQMCVAGTRYRDLLERRVVEFVRYHEAAYFKWDGIQFSCSEPDHGHPVGIHSRRAVMDSVIALAEVARREDPEMFLNITSGTWLSPWWVQYANTIWMQGRDYGYSDVPSITQRDRAMTYRDVVLYENYGVNDHWFPIANLMTHGIIKGHLQKLGGEAEPLDRFTDNAVLYFARGVTMWELYVSPNLLSEEEWDAIAQSVLWAEDRFDVLKSTEMIGGDPGRMEPYGYAHYSGERGIIAARNPFVAAATMRVDLATEHGLSLGAASLVLERVYPTHWISPKLYAAGATVELPLGAYETAIYEIYPVEQAHDPLLAGVVFESERDGDRHGLRLLETTGEVRWLNPERVATVDVDGRELTALQASRFAGERGRPELATNLESSRENDAITLTFDLDDAVKDATVAILVRPATEDQEEPEIDIRLDDREIEARIESQEASWSWHLVDVEAGRHALQVRVGSISNAADGAWQGTVGAWLLYGYRPDSTLMTLTMNESGYAPANSRTSDRSGKHRPLPPQPRPSGELRHGVELGRFEISRE